MLKFNKESGQASRLLLVLAVVVLVAVIITFLVMKMAQRPPAPAPVKNPVVTAPVYEKQLGDIDFIFESALDRGSDLKISDVTSPQSQTYVQQGLHTTGKFIQVTVGARNNGTQNTEQGAWTIQNVVDSEGRNFVPTDDYTVSPWLPARNSCGVLLKPAFAPVPCTKIYEVSTESTGLKIKVATGQGNTSQNLSSGKTDSFLIDLIVK